MRGSINARQTVLDLLPRGSVGAEIGVFKGDFSALILRNVKPKKLYLVDPWQSVSIDAYRNAMYGSNVRSQREMDVIATAVEERFGEELKTGAIEILRHISSRALATLEDGALDWVYIDGDHTFDGVSADLEMSYKKVKSRGLIAGDDYTLGNWFGDGVVRGLHRFLGEHGVTVRIVFVIDGQFVLQKL